MLMLCLPLSGSAVGQPHALADTTRASHVYKVNELVYFTATNESNNITAYIWDFDDAVDVDTDGNFTNDNESYSASSASAFHTYDTEGNYTATLTVFDDVNGTNYSSWVNVDVRKGAKPVVDAGPDRNAFVDEVIEFDINVTDVDDSDYNLTAYFDFDDSDGIQVDDEMPLSLSSLFSITHAYNATGAYTVTIHVTDGIWNESDTLTVTVEEAASGPITVYEDPFERTDVVVKQGSYVAYRLTVVEGEELTIDFSTAGSNGVLLLMFSSVDFTLYQNRDLSVQHYVDGSKDTPTTSASYTWTSPETGVVYLVVDNGYLSGGLASAGDVTYDISITGGSAFGSGFGDWIPFLDYFAFLGGLLCAMCVLAALFHIIIPIFILIDGRNRGTTYAIPVILALLAFLLFPLVMLLIWLIVRKEKTGGIPPPAPPPGQPYAPPPPPGYAPPPPPGYASPPPPENAPPPPPPPAEPPAEPPVE